jgi:hypothetical protein
MALTPEQKVATEELEAAIMKVVRLHRALEPESVLVDWMVLVEGMGFEGSGDSLLDFGMLFRGGQVRHTVALGMLSIANDQLLTGPEPREEGD